MGGWFCQKWNFFHFYLLSILIHSLTFRLSFFLPNLKNVLVTGNLRKADKTRIGNLRKILLFSLHNLLKTGSIMCSTWPMHAQWTSCQFSEISCLDSFPCFDQTIQLGCEVFLRIKLKKRLFIFHLSSQRGSSLCDHHHHEHQRQNWRSKLQSRFCSPTASPSLSSIKLAMIGKRLKVRDQLELPFEILPDLLTSIVHFRHHLILCQNCDSTCHFPNLIKRGVNVYNYLKQISPMSQLSHPHLWCDISIIQLNSPANVNN